MEQHAGTERATFGQFGAAMVREVFTPAFLRRQLNAALEVALKRAGALADLGVGIGAARAETPTLISDDGRERRFAVTVKARLEADVGPRVLGIGVDADTELDLTIRVCVFRPAIVKLDIDPVTPDDLRFRVKGRTGWLRLPLLGGDLSRLAEGSMGEICAGVNRALDASEPLRRIDVSELLRRVHSDGPEPPRVRSGTLEPGERTDWRLDLGEYQTARLHLWAGILEAEPPATAELGSTGPAVPVELSLHSTAGPRIDDLALPVRRVAPDRDTTATGEGVAVTAILPAVFRARLANRGGEPVGYRVEERRQTVQGDQIDFARFGEVLPRRTLDERAVTDLANAFLAQAPRLAANGALPSGTELTVRVRRVRRTRSTAHELCFRLHLEADVRGRPRPEGALTEVAGKLRVTLTARLRASLDPAALLLDFTPVARRHMRLARVRGLLRGRWLPMPGMVLAVPLRGRLLPGMNEGLRKVSQRIVVADLAANAVPNFADDEDRRGDRVFFRGVAGAGEPKLHRIELAGRQRCRARARVSGHGNGRTDGELVAELALCDENGGVWAFEQALVPGNGRTEVVGLEFTAPRSGQWRLRVASVGPPGELEYDMQVRADA